MQMFRPRKRVRTLHPRAHPLLLVLMGLAVVIGPANAQQLQRGVVTGVIFDSTANAGVPDVNVVVVGTARATRSDQSGHFRLVDVPTGPQRLQVYRIGYRATSKPVIVPDAGEVTLDFVVAPTSAALSTVVVTGTSGTTQVARENGNTIGLIATDSVALAPVTSFSDLLSARVSGLTVLQNTGTVGTGSRIRIRGISSETLSNEPLLVIDGVRADNGVTDYLFGLGGQAISRYDDLDFDAIDNVEVLKGPAAAALYGTEAASGVLVITTKQGQPGGRPSWTVHGQLGSLQDPGGYPPNFGRPAATGTSPSGFCPLFLEEIQACAGAGGLGSATPTVHFSPLARDNPFIRGYDEGAGLSVAGGGERVTYYLGGNWSRQQGIYANNQDRHTQVTANVATHIGDNIDIGITGGYVQRRVYLPLNDNALFGIVGLALDGFPTDDPVAHGYALGVPIKNFLLLQDREAVDRYTTGANGTWRLLPWLTARGTVGLDYAGAFDTEFYRSDLIPQYYPTGLAQDANGNFDVYTGTLSLAAKYDLGSALTATTTVGGEWVDNTFHQFNAFGQGLTPGTGNLNGTSSNFGVGETNTDIVNIGGYLQEQFGWRSVLFASVSGRLDGNSAFGANNNTAFYPSASVSYVISDERFWPKTPVVSSLRFRAAAGQSGREPHFRLATASFTGAAYKPQLLGQDQTGLIPNSTGNASLKPERSTEYETGLDIGLFRERLAVQLTLYDKWEADLIQAVPVGISSGIASLSQNLGKVDNRGFEFSATGNLFTSQLVDLDLNFTGSINRNKLVNAGHLGPSPFGFQINQLVQEDIAGQPLGVFFAVPYTFKDLNHDGLIEPNEITYGANPVFIGEPGPRDEWSIQPAIRLLKFLKVSALFDRRDGITLDNVTEEVRCVVAFRATCLGANDPHAPLFQQARAVAANAADFGGVGTDFGYLENGSFLKLREISFALSAPRSWARRLGASAATLTVAGRNLKTWTNYTGIDPEASANGGSSDTFIADANTQPLLKTWITRIDITW